MNLTVVFVVCLQQSLSSQPGLLPLQRFIKCLRTNRPVFTEANLLCVETSYRLSLKDLLRFKTHSITDTVYIYNSKCVIVSGFSQQLH